MRFVLLFLLSISFISCVTTNYITIDIKEPAAVTFPSDIRNVLIVDNTIQGSGLESINDSKMTIMSTDSAKSLVLNSLIQFMNEEKYFEKIAFYPKKTNNTAMEINLLPESEIRSLCQQSKSDVVVSFDLYTISAGIESSDIYYAQNYRLLSAHSAAILGVYDSNGIRLSPPIVYLDSLFLESYDSWGKKTNNLSEINGLVSEISLKTADALTGALVPSWKPQERLFYSNNSSEMKQAAKLAMDGKWSEAANLWGNLYDLESNINKKIRLAFNLALANECLDDIDKAQSWISMAYDHIPNKSQTELSVSVLKYKEILDKRQKNKSKLYKQLGLDTMSQETPPIDE